MKTLPALVSLSSIDRSAPWWPALHVKRGRTLFELSPLKASNLQGALCAGKPNSECRNLPLYDNEGWKIGFVSYNGRVWLDDVDGRKEIPLPGVKTAAQHEAEGWKDFKCAS